MHDIFRLILSLLSFSNIGGQQTIRNAAQSIWGSWRRYWKATALMLACVVAACGTGMGIGWAFRTKPLDNAPPSLYRGRQMYVDLTMQSVDPLAEGGMFTVSWNIFGDDCLANHTRYHCSSVNIYMDEYVPLIYDIMSQENSHLSA